MARILKKGDSNMIQSKADLAYYMECDRIAMSRTGKAKPWDLCYYFVSSLRKYEYWHNIRGPFAKIARVYAHIRFKHISEKCGFTIPINRIGPGLCIPHYGTIVISDYVSIGENCKIHVGVNIGATSGNTTAKKIGNNVYIGPGAKLVGDGVIGDDAVIGANAVVVGSVPPGITVGGVPAKKISDMDSSLHLIKATEFVEYKVVWIEGEK